jgi:hypothetical protein
MENTIAGWVYDDRYYTFNREYTADFSDTVSTTSPGTEQQTTMTNTIDMPESIRFEEYMNLQQRMMRECEDYIGMRAGMLGKKNTIDYEHVIIRKSESKIVQIRFMKDKDRILRTNKDL